MRTNSPTIDTTPTSNPGLPSTTTTSPTCRETFCVFLKKPLRLFLKRTSTISNWLCPPGITILESQSNTPSLLHPPELQVPLFLQPRGTPPELEQLAHPIVSNYLL